MDDNNIFLLLAFFVALMWGLGPLRHKTYLNHISPLTLICIFSFIYFIATIPLIIYCKKQIHKDITMCNKWILLEIFIIVIVTSFIPYAINFWMLNKKPAHIVTALTFCAPIFTVLAALFIVDEHVHLLSIIGVLLIVIGAICIGYSSSSVHN